MVSRRNNTLEAVEKIRTDTTATTVGGRSKKSGGNAGSRFYISLRTAGGRLRVLAVCVDVPRETWLRQRALLPADWTAGFDADDVIDGGERYVLRAMPSLYLLDSDKKVLLKDVPPAAVSRFCARM